MQQLSVSLRRSHYVSSTSKSRGHSQSTGGHGLDLDILTPRSFTNPHPNLSFYDESATVSSAPKDLLTLAQLDRLLDPSGNLTQPPMSFGKIQIEDVGSSRKVGLSGTPATAEVRNFTGTGHRPEEIIRVKGDSERVDPVPSDANTTGNSRKEIKMGRLANSATAKAGLEQQTATKDRKQAIKAETDRFRKVIKNLIEGSKGCSKRDVFSTSATSKHSLPPETIIDFGNLLPYLGSQLDVSVPGKKLAEVCLLRHIWGDNYVNKKGVDLDREEVMPLPVKSHPHRSLFSASKYPLRSIEKKLSSNSTLEDSGTGGGTILPPIGDQGNHSLKLSRPVSVNQRSSDRLPALGSAGSISSRLTTAKEVENYHKNGEKSGDIEPKNIKRANSHDSQAAKSSHGDRASKTQPDNQQNVSFEESELQVMSPRGVTVNPIRRRRRLLSSRRRRVSGRAFSALQFLRAPRPKFPYISPFVSDINLIKQHRPQPDFPPFIGKTIEQIMDEMNLALNNLSFSQYAYGPSEQHARTTRYVETDFEGNQQHQNENQERRHVRNLRYSHLDEENNKFRTKRKKKLKERARVDYNYYHLHKEDYCDPIRVPKVNVSKTDPPPRPFAAPIIIACSSDGWVDISDNAFGREELFTTPSPVKHRIPHTSTQRDKTAQDRHLAPPGDTETTDAEEHLLLHGFSLTKRGHAGQRRARHSQNVKKSARERQSASYRERTFSGFRYSEHGRRINKAGEEIRKISDKTVQGSNKGVAMNEYLDGWNPVEAAEEFVRNSIPIRSDDSPVVDKGALTETVTDVKPVMPVVRKVKKVKKKITKFAVQPRQASLSLLFEDKYDFNHNHVGEDSTQEIVRQIIRYV
ncbi:hypothetical protein HDU76_007788 [Blyttiomyces sp. JEL0837]|nr:hypothetical protein HDU76_007788 [Blyttiomyces sp. JEL0837]